jgi:hypothetical protein
MPSSAAVAEDFDESAFAEPLLLSLQALNASGSTAAAARVRTVRRVRMRGFIVFLLRVVAA